MASLSDDPVRDVRELELCNELVVRQRTFNVPAVQIEEELPRIAHTYDIKLHYK